MAETVRVGVLDTCPKYPGVSAVDALRASVQMAPLAESLGYSRYWVAEHHFSCVSNSCPEILIPTLASTTSRIRIGTAGILLKYYSPLKVASTFRTLNALYPGRIDLGLARGSVDEVRGRELGIWPEAYADQVGKVAEFARGGGVTPAYPERGQAPEVWVLGSAGASNALAAAHGCSLCLAAFLDFRGTTQFPELFAGYRDRFVPCAQLSKPHCALAVAGICADTETRARQLLADHREVIMVRPTVVGNPAQCRSEIERLKETCDVDEIVFLDLCKRFEDRARSYELLGAALGLQDSRPEVSCVAAA